jgi:hypothetical protein
VDLGELVATLELEPTRQLVTQDGFFPRTGIISLVGLGMRPLNRQVRELRDFSGHTRI